MNSKPHRTNSKFQLRHFLVGDCSTPDGGWSLLYGQKIDMEVKLQHSDAQRLRREAKIASAEDVLNDPTSTRGQRLEAQADIVEANAGLHVWELNLQAAKNELRDIEELMAELEPACKYNHLPILERTEAGQREEWLGTQKQRCENFMLTTGQIPPDELRFMRNHPDFDAEIAPYIQHLTHDIARCSSVTDGLKLLSKPFSIALPKPDAT